MNNIGLYLIKLRLNSKHKVAIECIYILLTIVTAAAFSSYFGIIVNKLSFLSPNIEFGIIASIFSLTVVHNGVYAHKFTYDNEIKFLRSLGFDNWALRMIYLFNLRHRYYFQMVLIFACFYAISNELFIVFVALYALFVYVLLIGVEGLQNRNKNIGIRKAFVLGKLKVVLKKRHITKTGNNRLMALIKNDLNIAGKIMEIKLFLLIYVLFNVTHFNSDYLAFNGASLFYVFLVSLTSEKIFNRNKELKKLYSVLGIEFKSFYISKLITLCVMALFPVIFFLSIKTVWGAFSLEVWLLSVVLNIVVSLSCANYWVSVFTRFWEGSNAFVISIFAFCLFIPPLIYIVPMALHKSSYKIWRGGC